MKKTKVIIISLIAITLLSVGGLAIYNYFTSSTFTTTLNNTEKKWLQTNKNKVFDISLISDIPLFNHNDSGIFYNFLKDASADLSIDFNKIPYNYGSEATASYALGIKAKAADNDLLIYEDHYVLVTSAKVSYHNLASIKNVTIGVLSSSVDTVSKYLKNGDAIAYKTYDSYDSLIQAVLSGRIDGAVLPRIACLQSIVSNNLTIAYHLTEVTEDYVLSLGSDETLNSILTKTYQKWAASNLDSQLDSALLSEVLIDKKIEASAIANFRSIQYQYGYINNSPFDTIYHTKLSGINYELIQAFASFTDIEVKYQEYDTINDLLKAFNANEVDFFLGINGTTEYSIDTYETVSIVEDQVVILTNYNNDYIINSLASLEGKTVLVLKNTALSEYLSSLNIKVKEYGSIGNLLSKMTDDSIVAIDYETYLAHQDKELTNAIIAYTFDLNSNYGYVIRNVTNNQVFSSLLDFYIQFFDTKEACATAHQTLLTSVTTNNVVTEVILYIVSGIALIFIIYMLYRYLHIGFKKVSKLAKIDKIKYIDDLTSLKNRAYLNDNIENWDTCNIYPQAIIITDLNNVAYINDNYGHAEGDNLIKEAANILIKNQMADSEIIRTSGNEFLTYVVNQEEKNISNYVKKLNKDMKELSHGFGAAAGYSMITDATKTIDDAINEATINMRSLKAEQEANNQKETN